MIFAKKTNYMRQVILENVKDKNLKSSDNYIKISELGFRDVALIALLLLSIGLTIYTYMTGSEYFTHLIGGTSVLVLVTFIKALGSIRSQNTPSNE